jgi:C-terminal processing protease CtpA/Prc
MRRGLRFTGPVRCPRSSGLAGVAVLMLVLGGVLAASRGGFAEGATPAASEAPGVVTVTGQVTVTNPLLLEALSEPYILLADLTNFVHRDINAKPQQQSQIMARLEGDAAHGSFTLPLPIAPRGTVNDLNHGAPGHGVQVYSLELSDNFIGDPFYGPFEAETGWGTEYSSMRVENGTSEVSGGKVVVFAPDDHQLFPTGFGPDHHLFTADDPLSPLSAGWTVIDLERQPFVAMRQPTVDVPIIEGDGGLKDLSKLGYTAAFDALVDDLRLRYPFSQSKHLDFAAITSEIRPLVQLAERDSDPLAFNIAMARFAVLFHDGHVGVSQAGPDLRRRYGASFGFTLGQTDDGTVVVKALSTGAPGDRAGIARGAVILDWNDRPVAAALAAQELVFPVSSPHTKRLQQLVLLSRSSLGAAVAVRYQNPGSAPASTTLIATADDKGLFAAFAPPPENPAELPVTVKVLPSGVGYIRVNTFFDDLALVAASWEWALTRLNDLGVPALIVDVRGNSGGAGQLATYFAGSFTDKRFDLADAYYAGPSGQLVYAGTTSIDPAPIQWTKPVAIVIDAKCASACEIFTAAVAQNPAHRIVGQYPTAGVEGAIYPWNLPDNLYFQAPLGLYQKDGQVFIEGTGVQPTVHVPVTQASLTSDDDVVLAAAEADLQSLPR